MPAARTDAALVARVKLGDELAAATLIRNYRGYAAAIARDRFAPGLDFDDLMQEASIGLHKAAMTYNSDRGASFRTFATLCIQAQVDSAVKAANRLRHTALNRAVSIDRLTVAGSDEPLSLGERLPAPGPDAHDLFILRQRTRSLARFLAVTLPDREFRALAGVIGGDSYDDVADRLATTRKAVDNLVTTARQTARYWWESEAA